MAHRGNRPLCLFPMMGMEATCDGLHDPVDYLLKSVGANRSLIARANVRDLPRRAETRRVPVSTAFLLVLSRNGTHVAPTAPVEGAPPLISDPTIPVRALREHRRDMRVILLPAPPPFTNFSKSVE